MSDLASHLTALLPEPPARVLLLGEPGRARGLAGSGHQLVRAEEHPEVEAQQQTFAAVLWHGEDSSVDAGVAVARMHRSLCRDGKVIVAVPLPVGAAAAGRRQGSLPSRHQARLREIVRQLSEAGFAIRQERDLVATEPEAASWKVLVAGRDPFVVRSYRDGDEAAILRLFRASFHLERGLEHWRWKYAGGPWGRGRISLGADPAGELAAHYGGYPIPVWRDGRTFLALQIGDTMTDPAVRGAGRGKASLLARTVRHFFSVHRDGSFGFFYGFNTGPIQRFCRWFIGGSQDRPVRYLHRELEPAPEWQPGGYRVERIETFGSAFDRLFRRVAPAYSFLFRRDAGYLDWRYRQRPDARYVILAAWRFGRLVGWSVFLRRDQRLAWGDALFDPRHLRAAEPILAAALAAPELAGASRIEAWFSGGPAGWDRQLTELGFNPAPEPQGLGLIALADAEPEAFDRLGEMYTTMGDGDLF